MVFHPVMVETTNQIIYGEVVMKSFFKIYPRSGAVSRLVAG